MICCTGGTAAVFVRWCSWFLICIDGIGLLFIGSGGKTRQAYECDSIVSVDPGIGRVRDARGAKTGGDKSREHGILHSIPKLEGIGLDGGIGGVADEVGEPFVG